MVAFVGYTTLDRDTPLGTTYAEGVPLQEGGVKKVCAPNLPGQLLRTAALATATAAALCWLVRHRAEDGSRTAESTRSPPRPSLPLFIPSKPTRQGCSLLLRLDRSALGEARRRAVQRRNLSSRLPRHLRELARLLDNAGPTDATRREIRETVMQEAQKKAHPGGPRATVASCAEGPVHPKR
jgi:hypothetical protein